MLKPVFPDPHVLGLLLPASRNRKKNLDSHFVTSFGLFFFEK
jgi:hypothetical protein